MVILNFLRSASCMIEQFGFEMQFLSIRRTKFIPISTDFMLHLFIYLEELHNGIDEQWTSPSAVNMSDVCRNQWKGSYNKAQGNPDPMMHLIRFQAEPFNLHVQKPEYWVSRIYLWIYLSLVGRPYYNINLTATMLFMLFLYYIMQHKRRSTMSREIGVLTLAMRFQLLLKIRLSKS